MTFNSRDFFIFFPIVCLVYFVLPKRTRWAFLLAASYYFYMCWNAAYALLIFTSTLVTYLGGLLTERAGTKARKKAVLALSVGINLAILIFFKYSGFLTDNANRVLAMLGTGASLRRLDVLLPVGISFYTFQALSYAIDVYRGDVRAERSLLRYALYVSFFPQLVAGPIERSPNLLPQVWVEHSFDWERVRGGLYLMAWGFFEKMVIADRIAIAVDAVYADYRAYSGFMIVAVTALFGIQIYCDFNGYSHIAIGAAEVLGFRLMDNFRQPYFSQSIQEFWRRWHISLSTWFKDYLYIPLGGNRKGAARQSANILVTFLVSGLWHGASWHYVVWGGFHGAFQVLGAYKDRALAKLTGGAEPYGAARRAFRVAVTFALVTFTWPFFRGQNVSEAVDILRWAFSPGNALPVLQSCGLTGRQWAVLALGAALLLTVDLLHERGVRLRRRLAEGRAARCAGVLLFTACAAAVFLFGVWGLGYDAASFIYFQF